MNKIWYYLFVYSLPIQSEVVFWQEIHFCSKALLTIIFSFQLVGVLVELFFLWQKKAKEKEGQAFLDWLIGRKIKDSIFLILFIRISIFTGLYGLLPLIWLFVKKSFDNFNKQLSTLDTE